MTVTDLATGKQNRLRIHAGSLGQRLGSGRHLGFDLRVTRSARRRRRAASRSNKSSNNAVVLTDQTPMTKPVLVPPIVGNDTVTVNDLYTGALIQARNAAATPPTPLGGGYATGVQQLVAASGTD